MLAAYKLQLGRRAKELGQKSVGTWGKQNPISAETEERLMEGEGDFRLPPFPYPGLRSFDPKEGKLFFGRDHSVNEVKKRLANYGIATVLGGSGSGKSSLVRAGLLPYLNSKRRIPGRAGSWYMAEFRPRMNPLCELADALADQVMLPLLDIEAPGLAEAMGLTKSDRDEAAKQKLRDKMRTRFQEAQAKGGDAVRDSLLDFADRELDEIDKLASQGVRIPSASLILLLDQFEEVFRPEIVASQREALLDLVVGLHASIGRRNERNESAYKGGLFLAITMRSEELHRCAEHRGLSEVVNRSLYLLELLDPDNQEDAKDLREAIVQPARDVLDDWGVAYCRNRPDAPFADGMPAWLLSGAGRRLPHQSDQLPLLQHALQATWHAAMRRGSDDGFADTQFEIRPKDLPGQSHPVPQIPNLGMCLCVRANKAAERAKERFAEKAETLKQDGEKVLQAAFRSLAHRDDRGNWARRFADIGDIKAFLAADQNLALAKAPEEAVQDALGEFLIRGYLSGGSGSPYDISHEALIRNWPRFQNWLREPESAARALERVVQEIDPRSEEKRRQHLLDWIPAAVSEQLRPVLGPKPTLPRSWALQRLESMLERSALRERWQGIAPNNDNKELAKAVLEEIDSDRQYADGERRKKVRWKFIRKFGMPLVVANVIGLLVLWFTLEKAMSSLYAAHAESLLGAAVSERGAQWQPDLRARVTLRAVSYFDAASKLEGRKSFDHWVRDNILRLIFTPKIGKYLPTMTNEQLQARRAFDFTSRVILGRRFVITKLDEPVGGRTPNCLVIGNQKDWQQLLPEPVPDEQHWKRAFRVEEVEANGASQRSLRLEFGAADESGSIQVADSDLQISLPSGAWLCLSSDATVLTLSSPSKNVPDLYELQWTRCATESDCRKKMRDWRVRYVPIDFAQGEKDLPPKVFPCVTSIRHLPVGPQEQKAAKIQVRFTHEKTPGCTENLSSEIYSAEFFTGLSAPRAVQIPGSMKDLLTPCEVDETRTRYICKPVNFVAWDDGDKSAKSGQNIKGNIKIEIEARRSEADIFQVDVEDDNSENFAAKKVSLPAHRIDRAGITETGEVLLHDEGADVTWRFVAKRSRLEELLRKRGNCSGLPKPVTEVRHNQANTYPELEELGGLDIDSACTNVSK